eukprot:g58199.t1
MPGPFRRFSDNVGIIAQRNVGIIAQRNVGIIALWDKYLPIGQPEQWSECLGELFPFLCKLDSSTADCGPLKHIPLLCKNKNLRESVTKCGHANPLEFPW